MKWSELEGWGITTPEEVLELLDKLEVLRSINNDLKDAMTMDHLTTQQDLVDLRAKVRAWDKEADNVRITPWPGGSREAYVEATAEMLEEAKKELL
jgi:hypothetical protein